MTLTVKLLLVAALVLGIIIPFGYFLLGERTNYQNPLAAVLPGIDVELTAALEMLDVIAVPDTGELLAQGDGLAVEIQDGIGILLLLRHIDPGEVRVYIKPGLAGGEAGILTGIPLHRSPGGVTGRAPQPL